MLMGGHFRESGNPLFSHQFYWGLQGTGGSVRLKTGDGGFLLFVIGISLLIRHSDFLIRHYPL